jgi:hypothetical protein
MQPTTSDPIRQLIDAWDLEHAPGSAPHPDSIEGNEYQSDRDRVVAAAAAWAEPIDDRWEGPSDVEWIEYEAFRYQSIGSDVSRLAADALAGLARDMAEAGHFDAAGYRDHVEREAFLAGVRARNYGLPARPAVA